MTTFFRDPKTYGDALRRTHLSDAFGFDVGKMRFSVRPTTARRMFAGTAPAEIPHSPAELAWEKQACGDPVFNGILGNPAVEKTIEAAKILAKSMPNRGMDGDIPGNGSEQGFLSAKFPLIGTRSGPFLRGGTERKLLVDRDFAPFPAAFVRPRDLTQIHIHQSPRAEPGLSGEDLLLAKRDGTVPGINVVAVDLKNNRYCKVSER